MSKSKTVHVRNSFPVLGVLGVVFVTLKLTHYIDWSWVWVLAPFWVPTLFGLLVIAAILIVALIAAALSD